MGRIDQLQAAFTPEGNRKSNTDIYAARLKKLRLVIADPTSQRASLVSSVLRGIGVNNITRSTTSADTEAALASSPFDVAIIALDIRPKTIDELVTGLRRSRQANAHLPVLAIGGRVTQNDRQLAKLAGVNAVVEMPISGDGLRDRLLSILPDVNPALPGIQEI